jgi:hypothetical protein
MDQAILIKGLFKTRTRGFPWKSTAPTEEELRQQCQWAVDEMGLVRNFAAVNDKSWIWQMYCLLVEERRVQITYHEYETFMLGAVKRFEKSVQEEAQARRIARIVGISVEKRVATSHGSENIPIAEAVEVEAVVVALLGSEELQEEGNMEQEGTSCRNTDTLNTAPDPD